MNKPKYKIDRTGWSLILFFLAIVIGVIVMIISYGRF